MEDLFKWIKESSIKKHPVEVSAVAHYNLVRIHPFDDGNGRGARILMNLILIKEHYEPAIIRKEQRRAYLNALGLADGGFGCFCGVGSKQPLEHPTNHLTGPV